MSVPVIHELEYVMLEKLFSPDTVAVIGASRTPGKVGHDILANLITAGFSGTIIPVNPAGGKILDLQVIKELREYTKDIDQAIIA
ncbi:MAG: CoA-binding protein, partial [Desulfopila sp.]